uniref:Integrase core domain containing protein n=1 Tax=Solanum tuberosum TaxID=4113 RepID=M1DV43_SOLTU
MEGMMDRKVHAVNKHLDAFELRVLDRPAPIIDLSSFQSELASHRAKVHAILATPTVEPQATPTTLADETVLDVLFSGTAEVESAPTHTKGKRHRSSRTEEEKAQKRQRRGIKFCPNSRSPACCEGVVSTTDGAMRVIESTTEGSMMDDVGTTEGDPTNVPAGSGKRDPPAS